MRLYEIALLWLVLVILISNTQANEALTERISVRVASISFVPVKFDLNGNADRLEKALRQAHEGGAKISVAPEGALEGYVVNEIIAGEADAQKMNDVAVTIDSPIINRFQKLARELDLCMVFGLAERIDDDVYNCALFIDNEGKIRGKYHKMQFAEGYHPSWWFNRLGAKSRAFDTPFGRCGILICNDRWNPTLAKIPVLDGARFLIIPSFGSRSKAQDEAVLSRGQENGVPVVEANVGVTLIVNDGKIAAVDREEEGITFSAITIPPPLAADPVQRDRVEAEFIEKRKVRMKERYDRTTKRIKERSTK